MRKQDLFKMPLGDFELVDKDNVYHYALRVELSNDGIRCYTIKVKESMSSDHIFILECYLNEYGNANSSEGELKYKGLRATSGVGFLILHTYDTYKMLRELRLVPRGSFNVFAERVSEFNKNLFLCPMCREQISCGDAMSGWCSKCGNIKRFEPTITDTLI